MQRGERIVVKLSISLFCLFLLFMVVMIPVNNWVHPKPEGVLSRMERRDSEAAREIIDSYARELEAIAAAAECLEAGEEYWYALNWTDEYSSAGYYRDQLQEMPQELADALGQMEEIFPGCEESLALRKGQVGLWLTDDGGGFSLICYPGGELMGRSVVDDKRGTRCLDMGGGWELQTYYAPKG